MVYVPTDSEGAGRFSLSGGTVADGSDTTAEQERYLEMSFPGGCDGGGGNLGDKNLQRLLPEHCHTIYCDKAIYIPVTGGHRWELHVINYHKIMVI